MSMINRLKKDIKELQTMPKDVSVKLEIEEKRRKLEKILKRENMSLQKEELEKWIDINKPFLGMIWWTTYTIKNLLADSAKSWTAFLLTAEDGKKYKLRVCLDTPEIERTESLVKKHNDSMPDYYGEEKYPECSCFLFKRLDNAQTIDEVSKSAKIDNIYVNSKWLTEPHEMYKKPAKEMAKINLWSEMHTQNQVFRKRVDKWLWVTESIFSPAEFMVIKKFFDEHFKNDKLKYWNEHWDAHNGNWMIEKSNFHKAFAIDEGSIAENFLIWLWFGSFMNQDLNEQEVKKFLKWYYKIYPAMEFDRSYFELIYAIRNLKTLSTRLKNNKLEWAEKAKKKLITLIDCSHNNADIIYKDNIPVLYNFIHVNKKLHSWLTKETVN